MTVVAISSLDSFTSIMLSRSALLEIISGKRRGAFAWSIRGMLLALSPLYRTVINWRNNKFDAAIQGNKPLIKRLEVPVVSIGNLTTGGTGKTPMVIWICQWLSNQNFSVAIVSRGYGSKTGQNDEAKEMEARIPSVPHVQNSDRFEGGIQAVRQFAPNVIVLDDGFQHRKLHRDLDVVLIDATNPFGYDFLLPRGLLREPVKSLDRADVVVITRVDRIPEQQLAQLTSRIRSLTKAPIATAVTRPANLLSVEQNTHELESVEAQPVFVACAIGNPENFVETCRELKMNVVGTRFFSDHHHFTKAELLELQLEAKSCGASKIVCTHKDLVKVPSTPFEVPILALQINFEFLTGQSELTQALLTSIGRTNSSQ